MIYNLQTQPTIITHDDKEYFTGLCDECDKRTEHYLRHRVKDCTGVEHVFKCVECGHEVPECLWHHAEKGEEPLKISLFVEQNSNKKADVSIYQTHLQINVKAKRTDLLVEQLKRIITYGIQFKTGEYFVYFADAAMLIKKEEI